MTSNNSIENVKSAFIQQPVNRFGFGIVSSDPIEYCKSTGFSFYSIHFAVRNF